MNVIRLVITVLLALLAIFLGYRLYKTIQEPILFEKNKVVRDEANIAKLKDLRSLELAYKSRFGRFAGGIDTLKSFAKSGKLPILKRIGDPNDSTKVSRVDTLWVTVIDSLFKGNVAWVDTLGRVPYTGGEKYDVRSGIINKNDVLIPAFEISAPYTTVYKGLIQKYYTDKVGKDMRVGSMLDGTTTGNWEN
ncbi:MAG: hypothetical protein R2798_02285 [Chitinophagales bacterium]|nr:hypothetical protein [Bacteroidota bacterium]MCB9042151.1 hypothetical protein [Chitinophagales bacterium]